MQKYQLKSRLPKDSMLSSTNQSMIKNPQHTINGTGAVNWDLRHCERELSLSGQVSTTPSYRI